MKLWIWIVIIVAVFFIAWFSGQAYSNMVAEKKAAKANESLTDSAK